MNKIGTWVLRALGVLLGLIVIIGLVAAFSNIPEDVLPAPEDYGAGASSVIPSYTGLEREFPAIDTSMVSSSPEREQLGYLLFFDPVLSENNDLSCAHCHHPDYGFSDGLPRALGAGAEGYGAEREGGVELARNTLTIWNVAYSRYFFWDGRVESLEYQAIVPIQHPDEMASINADALVEELREIPEYVALFDAAFGGSADSISVNNIVFSIATFERTLLSNNSPFDRYAAGDLEALTAAQRRGLNLFRSAALRCFECHATPTFSTDTFRVIGVPDVGGFPHDSGREGVVADGDDGAFKVPTLRNIAITGPYMHNGIFETLEDAIAFYADGGGRAFDQDNIDPFVRGFELSDQETQDLVAFLYSLTDESSMPDIPSTVPSGFPVVGHLENPARAEVAKVNSATGGESVSAGSGETLTVLPGQSIQDVVDQARPGDTVMIPYGTYHERVVIDLNEITLYGIPNSDGEYPTLDGQNELSEAVISSGSNFEVAYLRVVNYTDNGILVEGVTGVHIHHIYAENTGTYGLYPVQSTDVLVEDSEVIGANDAGIYAGQCMNVIVRNNIVHGNVLGIELENVVNGEISGTHAYNNTNGILVVLLPQLTSKVSLNTKVFDNLVESNNLDNFAKAGTAAAKMPAGSGIALVASDQVEVYNNTIRDHKTAGLGIFSLLIAFNANEVDIGPIPEHILIHDNIFENNGYEPAGLVKDLGLPGADILWDVSGIDVHVDQPEASTFPPIVPTSSWSDILYKIYWQAMNFLIGLIS